MNTTKFKKKKILYLFEHEIEAEYENIKNKKSPSERLYGFIEMKNSGWNIDISDITSKGAFFSVIRFLRKYGINLINFGAIRQISKYDIIIVKGSFSLFTTIICRLLGKKIIYKDSMFVVPKRFWKRWSAFINLRLATGVIAYSKFQANVWEKEFSIPQGSIHSMHYCIDVDFYPDYEYEPTGKNNILSIGRDMGRDYECVSNASENCNLNVKLVTLPYLLSDNIIKNKNIEILEKLSYSDLFRLYKEANFSVVPLKKDLDYPSGIRGILESMSIGLPTIVSWTPVLAEMFNDEKDVMYFEAGNQQSLCAVIKKLNDNEELCKSVAANGKAKVRSIFNMETYHEEFEKIMLKILSH